MTIITHGNPDLLHNPQTFTCEKCRCVFQATDEEYDYADYLAAAHDGIYATCKCPCCENTVYLYCSETEPRHRL